MVQGNLKRMTPEDHEAQVRYWEEVFAETFSAKEQEVLGVWDSLLDATTAARMFLRCDPGCRDWSVCVLSEGVNWKVVKYRFKPILLGKPSFWEKLDRWIGRYVGW